MLSVARIFRTGHILHLAAFVGVIIILVVWREAKGPPRNANHLPVPMEQPSDEPAFDMRAAVELNLQKLQQRFATAQESGHRWLAECRDLGDAFDRDAGVYFVECRDDAAVDEVVARCKEDDPYDRLLGIYDLTQPLRGQAGGMTRGEWLSRKQ
jgi:hypothetical protein